MEARYIQRDYEVVPAGIRYSDERTPGAITAFAVWVVRGPLPGQHQANWHVNQAGKIEAGGSGQPPGRLRALRSVRAFPDHESSVCCHAQPGVGRPGEAQSWTGPKCRYLLDQRHGLAVDHPLDKREEVHAGEATLGDLCGGRHGDAVGFEELEHPADLEPCAQRHALGDQRSAVAPYQVPGTPGFPAVLGAVAAPYQIGDYLQDRKLAKYMNRAAEVAVVASSRALQNANIPRDDLLRKQMALFVSTGYIAFDMASMTQNVDASLNQQGQFDLKAMGQSGIKLATR